MTTTADKSASYTDKSVYVLWYHNPNDNNYSLGSYTQISEVSTPDAFWSLIDAIPKDAWEHGMFFFMKKGFKPLWDAPENDKGGAWSKKVNITDIHEIFVDAMIQCFCGSLLSSNPETLVGVSTSPKGQFHIIKVWNTLSTFSDRKYLNKNMKMKIESDVVYKAHNTRPK